MRLKDKVAVVTGAGSGIGLAIAQRFVAEGANVVAADWNEEAIEAAARSIGGSIVAVTVNVADETACIGMIDRAVAEFGRIDVLVNNAGVMDGFQSVADIDNETWRRCLAVNLDGPMFAMRRTVPLMLANGGGSIINIASVAALGGGAAGAAYTASKHALIGLSQSTAFQYAKQGLRCNALAVGGVSTNIMASVADDQLTRVRSGAWVPITPAAPARLNPSTSPTLCCSWLRTNPGI
jgi:NAD(P)-dependent dehydrogenase (short-subunit alcohol dehydrogenase family)